MTKLALSIAFTGDAKIIVSLIPWFLYICAWIITLVQVQSGAPFWVTLLTWVVIFNGGMQGLWGALGHLAFPQRTAQKIGWTSNGFQVEIGFTNLAMGITGLGCIFYPAWVPAIALFIVIYYAGCAYNHIKERVLLNNKSPCNSGPMLYSTIVTVITLICGLSLQAFMHIS